MLRAIKIRLYPNAKQLVQFRELLGCYRFVYNQCLEKKITAYKEQNVSENLKSLSSYLHHTLLKDPNYDWLKRQNTKVLGQALADMLSAYNMFFKAHRGFPKFKSKRNNTTSCRFPLGAISKRNVYTDYKISIANIRNLKFHCSRKYAEYLQKHKDHIRQATLKQLPCGEYYLSILVDGDLIRQVEETNTSIGIDLGVKNFVVTSEGEVFSNLHFKKSEINKIKKAQRQLSRKQKGSKNRNKARVKLAKLYKKISDRKQYYLHSVSNLLIDENQVICIEDLNVQGMSKNHSLAESILEMNFRGFRRMLEYKASWYNRKIVIINRFYPSSKTCNHCGYINKALTLNDRKWVCPNCKNVIDRDYNAASNILNEGLRLIGCSTAEFTLVDYPTVDDQLSNETLKSSDRLKQEVFDNHIFRFKNVL